MLKNYRKLTFFGFGLLVLSTLTALLNPRSVGTICFLWSVNKVHHTVDAYENKELAHEDVTLATNASSVEPLHLQDNLLDRFIILPEAKLMFCFIEKVGCTSLNFLLNSIRLQFYNGTMDEEEKKWMSVTNKFRITPQHFNLSKSDLESMMADHEWTKAVFYRNPLERFLSAYISKCTPGHDSDRHCCIKVFGAHDTPFERAISKVESVVTRNRSLVRDPHWTHQVDFCGGVGDMHSNYDFVYNLDRETVRDHMEEILRKVGIDPVQVRALDTYFPRPETLQQPADSSNVNSSSEEKWKAEMETRASFRSKPHLSPKHTTNAKKKLCSYFTNRHMAEVVESYYKRDYKAFGINERLECAEWSQNDRIAHASEL